MHETGKYNTLTDVAKTIPGRPSTNCIWRWCRKGVLSRSGQRVRLQHVRIGGKLFTSGEWVTEFGRLLAEADTDYFSIGDNPAPSIPAPRSQTDNQREKAYERAERELKEMGV